jgi:hypothetical protein
VHVKSIAYSLFPLPQMVLNINMTSSPQRNPYPVASFIFSNLTFNSPKRFKINSRIPMSCNLHSFRRGAAAGRDPRG